ncbi:MAG: glycosyl hydrolase family 18 protein [Terriglobales bacterium]
MLCLAASAQVPATTASPQGVFYAMPGPKAVASFLAHADSVGVFAPQSFSLDRYGVLRGSVPDALSTIARAHGVPIMPLVINAGFSRIGAERLLRSPSARDRAVGALVSTARLQGYLGWQVDFENLPSWERHAFSHFIAELAGALHRQGLQLSVAVAARTSSDVHGDNYRNFSGVYDYAALAHTADFLSVMAYPENSGSQPGPLASAPWVEQVIAYISQFVPPDKFSLGIPTYQTDWMQHRVRIYWRRRIAGRIHRFYRTVYRIVHRSGPVSGYDDLQWNPSLQAAYRVSGSGHRRVVTWVADARSFRAKLQLVAEYHLRGYSVWRMGLEDPRIWNSLPDLSRAAPIAADTGDTPAPESGAAIH